MEYVTPVPIRLADLFESTAAKRGCGWVYVPRTWQTWSADTSAYVIDSGSDADADAVEAWAAEHNYVGAIDTDTFDDVVYVARTQLGIDTFAELLETLVYYYRFDAFLPRVGAPDPPPWAEVQREMDRQFYDSLGPERVDAPCRRSMCSRGAVSLSALCKVHHFEQIRRRACPFDD